MSSDSGLNKLEAAFERIKNGNTTLIPAGAKLTIRNVETEAGMGDGSAYYYPEFIDVIKATKKDLKTHGRRSFSTQSTSISSKNKELTKRNEELVTMNKQLLVSQAELSHNLFKQSDGNNVIQAYKKTLHTLQKNKDVK
jgi:hypothetical protein